MFAIDTNSHEFHPVVRCSSLDTQLDALRGRCQQLARAQEQLFAAQHQARLQRTEQLRRLKVIIDGQGLT